MRYSKGYLINIYSEKSASSWDLCSFWNIVKAHVGGVVTRVYKLAPPNHRLTNIHPMEIMGEVLHATESGLSSTRLRLGAYA